MPDQDISAGRTPAERGPDAGDRRTDSGPNTSRISRPGNRRPKPSKKPQKKAQQKARPTAQVPRPEDAKLRRVEVFDRRRR